MIGKFRRISIPFLLLVSGNLSGGCKGCGDRVPEPQAPDTPESALSVGDLPSIVERGTLRLLVVDSAEPRLAGRGSPRADEHRWMGALGQELGLQLEIVPLRRHDALIPALLEGRGDVIAALLTVTETRRERVAFTSPWLQTEEWLVGRAGSEGPATMEELVGRTVHVRPSASYADTLGKIRGVTLEHVPEHVDTESILEWVAHGRVELTVADRSLVDTVKAYAPELKPLFKVAEDRNVGWAVRPNNPKLLQTIDAFVLRERLRAYERKPSTGDLGAIKQRGVLRVLTRNNGVSYFLYRGRPMGFDYELVRMFADELGVGLDVIVPPRHDLLIPWLEEGRGDVIAASLTVTPTRQEHVSFSTPYLEVQERLVSPPGAEVPDTLGKVHGKKVYVRKSSSYFDSLQSLQESVGPFEVVPLDESLETEDVLAQVERGEIPLSVSDSHLLDVELAHGSKVQVGAPLVLPRAVVEGAPTVKPIAFAVRKTNPELLERLNAFRASVYRGLEFNLAKRRYFEMKRDGPGIEEGPRSHVEGQISPFDDLFKEHGAEKGFDWRLLAAQAYQESRFNPRAKSWAGARGLFQLMPATAADLGVKRIEDPARNTDGATRYLSWLREQFDGVAPEAQLRLALASYNAGIGHVRDAQALARRLGLRDDVWFDNVEKTMLLLQKRKYYTHARYGYVRGREPVGYVRVIQELYDRYVEIVELEGQSAKEPQRTDR